MLTSMIRNGLKSWQNTYNTMKNSTAKLLENAIEIRKIRLRLQEIQILSHNLLEQQKELKAEADKLITRSDEITKESAVI